MPGSIRVSVLGFVDLATPPPRYPLSVKVAIGRKEYRSVGGAELSFPVVSLRENMMMMVHDAEGKELLKTEFRTIILLEIGQWDNLFPLKDGGLIHMKLQFSLSEEDRKRIREKRDSILKKKHVEDRKTKLRRSSSDNRIASLDTRTLGEASTGKLSVNSERANPDVYGNASDSSLLQVSEQNSECSLEKDAHHLTQSNEESKLSSEAASHSWSDYSRSSVPGNFNEPSICSGAELDKYIIQHPESKDVPVTSLYGNVRKMISALKTNSYQGAGVRFGLQEASLKCLTARRDTSSLKISQTMSKSYSEGMLSEISSRGNSKPLNSFFLKKQEMQNFLEATNHKTFESKIQPLDLNDEEKFHSLGANMPDNGAAKNCGSHADPSYSIPSSSSMENDNVRELMGSRKPANLSGFAGTSRERTGFASVKSKEASSAMPIHWKSEAVMNKVNPYTTLKEDHISDSNAPSSPIGKKLAEYITDKDKHGKRNTTGDERSASLEIVTNVKTEVLEVKENRNEEQGFVEKSPSSKKTLDELGKIENLYGVSTQKQESSVVVTTSGSEENVFDGHSIENVFDGHSIEQHVAGSLFGKEGALTYAYSSVCPFGTLGIWRPRHLCITTGNKQLRYFVESFSAFRGAYCIGSSSIREANKKEEEGDANIKRKDKEVVFSSRKSDNENSSGSLKRNKGLIEQGVRIIFIIVACGLLLNNR